MHLLQPTFSDHSASFESHVSNKRLKNPAVGTLQEDVPYEVSHWRLSYGQLSLSIKTT